MKIKIYILTVLLLVCAALTGCSGKGEDVPAGMQRASDDYVDYDFYAPSSWLVGENDGCINVRKSDSVLANVSVMAARVDSDITDPASYWEKFKSDFEGAFTDFSLESDETCLLDGHEAHRYVYTGKFSDVSAKYMQTVCVKGGAVYIVTYTASSEKYDEYLSDVEKMIEEFRFH